MSDLKTFHDDVKSGNLDAVRTRLDADSELLDAKNEGGQGALLLAMYYGKRDVADFLLSRGPRMDLFLSCVANQIPLVLERVDAELSLLEMHSSDGWTPLHLAAYFGHPELATALLDRGANVDSRSTNAMKNTPLHAAAAGRKHDVMRILLERGADVNARQEGGWTALHAAAQSGDREMLELLIAHGADVSARAENNQAALDLALLKGSGDIAGLLENLGAKL